MPWRASSKHSKTPTKCPLLLVLYSGEWESGQLAVDLVAQLKPIEVWVWDCKHLNWCGVCGVRTRWTVKWYLQYLQAGGGCLDINILAHQASLRNGNLLLTYDYNDQVSLCSYDAPDHYHYQGDHYYHYRASPALCCARWLCLLILIILPVFRALQKSIKDISSNYLNFVCGTERLDFCLFPPKMYFLLW